jgi:hypothetical protein
MRGASTSTRRPRRSATQQPRLAHKRLSPASRESRLEPRRCRASGPSSPKTAPAPTAAEGLKSTSCSGGWCRPPTVHSQFLAKSTCRCPSRQAIVVTGSGRGRRGRRRAATRPAPTAGGSWPGRSDQAPGAGSHRYSWSVSGPSPVLGPAAPLPGGSPARPARPRMPGRSHAHGRAGRAAPRGGRSDGLHVGSLGSQSPRMPGSRGQGLAAGLGAAGRGPAVGRHHHPAEVLSQIASPFAADPRPAVSEALDHAA